MIPTATCPYKCAINMVCGNELECQIGSIATIVGLSIFGLFFCCVASCFLCSFCSAARQSGHVDDHHDEFTKHQHKAINDGHAAEATLANSNQYNGMYGTTAGYSQQTYYPTATPG